MGLSISCQTFERFSTALQWYMEYKFKAWMSHVIDDFFFIGSKNDTMCCYHLQQFINICGELCIPIKDEKTVPPTTVITIYGIEVDSISMICRLPQDKIEKILLKLNYFKCKKKATLRELQSLLGLLNFATAVVVPGRTFLRRLYKARQLAPILDAYPTTVPQVLLNI